MTIGQMVSLSKSRIAGVVTCCPTRRINSEFFYDRFSEVEVANTQKISGVAQRFWVDDGQTSLDLSLAAARRLILGLNWSANDIDALVYVTQSPENILPSTSIRMAHMLGLPSGVLAFDINLGCSGYPYGLAVLMGMMENGLLKKALLVASETPSKIVDQYEKSTAMLFGDAGTVTAIEAGTADVSHFILGSDGSGADNLLIPQCRFSGNKLADDPRLVGRNPDYLYMDGAEIFNFTLKRVPPLVAAAQAQECGGNIDYYLFHQANHFMLEHLRKKMKLDPDMVPVNIADYGNTSVASIPLLITTKLAPHIAAGSNLRVGMFGFGVGYSWSSCVSTLNNKLYLEHFHDS
jgi:3-oxoacyl-[acyl-carrier-protein] synthase-3